MGKLFLYFEDKNVRDSFGEALSKTVFIGPEFSDTRLLDVNSPDIPELGDYPTFQYVLLIPSNRDLELLEESIYKQAMKLGVDYIYFTK